jgi:hydrogenase/urease accessory protein HupE
MRRGWLIALAAFVAGVFGAGPAAAHEVRPAYLEITQDGPHHYAVTWKQPVLGEVAIHLAPRLSNGWLDRPPADQFASASFLIRTWSIDALGADPLAGQTLSIDGLDRTITDVLVQVRLADGRRLESIVKPDHPSLALSFAATGGLPVPAYLRLGVEHILTGIDHLMFVLGLLLLIGVRWRLIKAITAFTLAHSITLAASAVGLVHVPSVVVEALVALSIVFVAAELAGSLRGRGGQTQRYPWLIAFTFGLLHGFAFAGALAEVGLPKDAIPLSLLLFNLGVEIGQLLFVGAAILVIVALRQLRPRIPAAWNAAGQRIPPYAIGAFAAFWFIERASLAFS